MVMRILAPAFAFWTAGEAAFECSRQQWRNKHQQTLNVSAGSRGSHFKYSVRDVMYAVEVSFLTMTGSMMACGQFGPMALPLSGIYRP